jgi:hypothetical protein
MHSGCLDSDKQLYGAGHSMLDGAGALCHHGRCATTVLTPKKYA